MINPYNLTYLLTAGPCGLLFPITFALVCCPPLPDSLAPAIDPSPPPPRVLLLPIKPSLSPGERSSSSSESISSPEETPSTPVIDNLY